MDTKICSKCKKEKSINEFYFRKDSGYYRSACKECTLKDNKKWTKENYDYIKEYKKEYAKNNKEKIRKSHEKYEKSHKAEISQKRKIYYLANKERENTRNKLYNQTHKEQRHDYYIKNREKIKEYQIKNKDRYRENARLYCNMKNANDKIFKLKTKMRKLLYKSFIRKGFKKNKNSEIILGCDNIFFINYLLQTFKNNYGYDWNGIEPVHIDHKKPLKYANTEEDVIKLCHYTNLQLLKAEDNLAKSDKLNWEL